MVSLACSRSATRVARTALGEAQIFTTAELLLRASPARYWNGCRALFLDSERWGASAKPAPPITVRAQHWLQDLPNRDIAALMFERFKKWPHNTAIIHELTGRSYTYKDLEDCSLRWGAALVSMCGGTAPQCVAILAPNVAEYPVVVFGSLAVGSTVTTLASVLTPTEIARQLADSGASVVVVDAVLATPLRGALQTMDSTAAPLVMSIERTPHGWPNLLDIINDSGAKKAQPVDNPSGKVALLPYSSGTTGPPKGVCLPHGSLSNFLKVFTHQEFFPYGEASEHSQQTSIGLVPFYHSFGLFALSFSSFYLGSKIVCLSKFTPLDYAEAVQKHKVRVLHVVPPLLGALAHSPQITSSHLATVSNVLIAGAPVHPAVATAFKKKAPNKIHFQEGLGLTETLALMVTPLSEERLGSCGRLLPNTEARVVDTDTGDTLGPDQPGELWVRGPGFMSHYHNNPEATAASVTQDGWFKTGDVAQYTADGWFSIVDRLKELIKVKAQQVSPSELEDLILQLDIVAEAGVVGVPDDRAGELPRAYVVLKQSVSDETVLQKITEDIHEHIRENAAPYKSLAGGVVFVKELPKNATGKMLRRELKKIAQEEYQTKSI